MQLQAEPVEVRTPELFPGPWVASIAASGERPNDSDEHIASGSGKRLWLQFAAHLPKPAVDVCDHVAVIFEGRLFDRSDLVSALGGPAEAQGDDASLVRQAFDRWGEGAVQRLNGIYAFCYWDARRDRLFAARDRAGACPLYYSREEKNLRFSTKAGSLAHSSTSGPSVDRAVIAGLLAHLPPVIEETCYREVFRVPAGHLLSVDRSGLRVERYWRLQPVGTGTSWMSEEEIAEFPERLDRAVGRALYMGQTGIFLSGGLDSISVAVAAEEHARRNGLPTPAALSFLFPDRLREESIQRGVAQQLGLPQTLVEFDETVGKEGMLAAVLALSKTRDAPVQNIWLPGYLKLAEAGIGRGCRAIMTGRGGDEWLTMFPIVAADLIASFDLRGLVAHGAATISSSELPPVKGWRSMLWSNGARPLLSAHLHGLIARLAPAARRRRYERSLAAKSSSRASWLAPDPSLQRVLDRRARQLLEEELRESPYPPGGFRHEGISGMLDNSLFAPTFEENYETSRSLGVMHHDVYWDPELIEFLHRVPPRLLNAGGRSKALVRHTLARRFPDLGLDRQKKLRARNFVDEVLLGEAEAAWRATGGAPGLASIGVVDHRRLEQQIRDTFARQDTRRLGELWRILRLESWVRPRV